MIAARWRRRGWDSREVDQDLELERDEAIVAEIPPEYWPLAWASRLMPESLAGPHR